MSTTPTRLDEELAENIAVASQVSSCILLVGLRQFDRFLLGQAEGAHRTVALHQICHESTGADATWIFDPAVGRVKLVRAREGVKMASALPDQVDAEKSLTLPQAINALSGLGTADTKSRAAVLVDAGLLFEDPATPREEDMRLLQAIERFARTSHRGSVLLLRTERLTSIPNAIVSSPNVRIVQIPSASRDVRHVYARKRSVELATRCAMPPDAIAQTLSNATEDWTLDQVDALVESALRQGITRPHDIEELARAVRIGTTYSPWAGESIHAAVSESEAFLTRRVLGQSEAVNAVALALRKAVVGLSNAHQGAQAQAPRAVFFFAGPTGTGKTELAKAVSQLVFGQEQLLRFDCGELRQEHAVARLIGAPPGYVGFGRGGELTDGIRAKPNSVVLFDEIEKAHPRLLDTLLGVLDDGRLTSGQGETSYFGQSLLIFTSNLGMYEKVVGPHGQEKRHPRFNYDTDFKDIERTVREAIRDEFTTELGRPELLGRFGGAESIIVFDYLRDLERVCRKFVANIASACKRLHAIELIVNDNVIGLVVDTVRQSPDSLLLGGRGLKPKLDRLLTDPLSDYLFAHPQTQGRLRCTVEEGKTMFLIDG